MFATLTEGRDALSGFCLVSCGGVNMDCTTSPSFRWFQYFCSPYIIISIVDGPNIVNDATNHWVSHIDPGAEMFLKDYRGVKDGWFVS